MHDPGLSQLRGLLGRAQLERALEVLIQAREKALKEATSPLDEERIAELLAMELLLSRELWTAAQEQERVSLLRVARAAWYPYRDLSSLAGQAYAALATALECPTSGRDGEALPVFDADMLQARAFEAWSTGRELEDQGRLREALEVYLIGKAWLCALSCQSMSVRLQMANLENSIGNVWRAWEELERSLAAYDRALRMGLEEDPDLLGCVHNNRGLTLRHLGRTEQSIVAFEQAIELWTRPGEPGHERLSWLAAAEGNLGNAFAQKGDLHRALARQRRNLQLNETLYQRDPSIEHLDSLAGCLTNLGNALRHQGLLEEGLDACRRARDMLAGVQTSGLDLRERLASFENNLGNALSECGRPEQAVNSYQAAIGIWQELRGEGHPGLLVAIGSTFGNLAMVWQELGQPELALRCQREGLELLRGSEPQPKSWHHLATAHANLSAIHSSLADWPAALDEYQRARQLWLSSLPGYPAAEASLARLEMKFGILLLHQHQPTWARRTLRSARARYQRLVGSQGRFDMRREQADCEEYLGCAFFQEGDHAAAERHLSRACELWSNLDESDALAGARERLGDSLLRLGQRGPALQQYALAVEHWSRQPRIPATLLALARLGILQARAAGPNGP